MARSIARLTLLFLVLSVACMVFLPWQQTSRGDGTVVALDPQLRIASVGATYDGVVKNVAAGLMEGSRVKKDQVILELEPFANDEIQLTRNILLSYREQLLNEQQQQTFYENQVAFVQNSVNAEIEKAKQAIEGAKNKLAEKDEIIRKYDAELELATANLNASKYLYEKGLEAGLDYVKYSASQAKASAELKAARESRSSIAAELQEKQAELSKAEANAKDKVAEQNRKVAEVKGKIQTTAAKISETEIKLRAFERLTLRAPFDGVLFRLIGAAGVQTVKKGDVLFMVVPDTQSLSVELLVTGNDTSFLREGQEVRLQFEGWPAVQFVGWPSVAVGTFGGRLQTIDSYSEGSGKFRILVVPDEDQEPWPKDQLRQGMRANGWVILNEVPLGFEIWRQLNGFPPSLDEPESKKSEKDEKGSKPKLPK